MERSQKNLTSAESQRKEAEDKAAYQYQKVGAAHLFRGGKVENKVGHEGRDITVDVLVLLLIFFLPSWLFCGLILATSWRSFYVIVIIFGASVVYFTMARWIWFNILPRLSKKGMASFATRQKAGQTSNLRRDPAIYRT
jgi:hypothetical protein